MWNNVVNAWWSIVFYPATDAPRFRKGMVAMLCVSVATLGATYLVYYLERRERQQKQESDQVDTRHDSRPQTQDIRIKQEAG